MKKWRGNRKVRMACVLALAVILSVGGTYAWFTYSARGNTSIVQLGEMQVDVELDMVNEDLIYEPGLTARQEGSLTNTGTVAFVAKLDVESTAIIYKDDDGKNLATPWESKDDANITISLDEAVLGYKDFDDGMVVWLYNVNDPEDVYLLVDGPYSAELALNILFDGPNMGNRYQNSQVHLTPTVFVTQTLDAAVEDIFGVPYEDLEMFEYEIGAGAQRMAARSGGSSVDAVRAKVDALFGR